MYMPKKMFEIHVLVLTMVCHVQKRLLNKNAKNYVFRDYDIDGTESDYLSSDDKNY